MHGVVVCVLQHGEDDQRHVHGRDRATGAGATDHGGATVPLRRHGVRPLRTRTVLHQIRL